MADSVKMKLTFPRGKQQPGEIVEIPADEVHRWKGFAEPVTTPARPVTVKTPDTPKPTAK